MIKSLIQPLVTSLVKPLIGGGIGTNPELWTQPDAIADGSLSGSSAILQQVDAPTGIIVGNTYQYSFDYDVQFGRLQIIIGNGGKDFTSGSSGTYTSTLTATATLLFVRQIEANSIGSFTNISVKKV